MPSFLNKVFGYKKNDDKEAARPTREASDSTLLDGKYEAIPSLLSPSTPTFTEAQPTKDSDRDIGFSFFRPKSQKSAQKHPDAVPYLTLRLPGPKENSDSRALGVVFEADPDSQTILDDGVIAAKRLNPLEALILIRACAQAITERGLETLGIMHPHWFSTFPDVQRKLISLFIRSLVPQNRTTTLPSTSTSPVSAFEDELRYTRSPHDIAAVLRWGLRHLSLENGHFGKDTAEWAWYNAFFHAERNASYPPKGFSELLLPQLPTSHTELLTVTLSLVSSLASHAELNGISGSKLSKFWGIWLLVATRVEQSDDWSRFYARWERAGRVLEHLFLARLREESFGQRLPTRLQELVKYYPYSKDAVVTEDELLSRPRFSTRQYDALFVRVETLLMNNGEQPKQHPIQLLLEAFQLPVENPSGDEHIALWNTLKTTASEEAASSDPDGPQFARIFVDETIQVLSLIPGDNNVPTSPTFLASPITKVVSRKRSSSLTKILERTIPGSSANNGPAPVSSTSPSSAVTTDWAQFSMTGFGDTPTTQPLVALLDQDDDVEVTQPLTSHKSSRQRGKSRTRRRRSEDHEPPETPPSSRSKPELSIVETKLASARVIQIDEAFIDFWNDAIVDPIAANWPTFVVCGLKQIPGTELPIRWLVIEQTFSYQQSQPPRIPSPDGHRGRSPRPSFRSDISGFHINSVFSSARKRFSVFSKSATDLDSKKSGGKTPITGELGEVLIEEEPAFPPVSPTKAVHHFDENAVAGATVTGGATANIADHLKVDDISTAPVVGTPAADLVPVLKDGSSPIQATAKVPSVESTPQSGGGPSAPLVLPRSSFRTSEEAVSVEQGLSRTLDVVNPKVNAADSVVKIASLAADSSNSWPVQDTSDLTAPAPGPTTEDSVIEEIQIRVEQAVQNVAFEADNQLVAQPTDGTDHLSAESTGEPSNVAQVDVADDSREVAEAVAMPPAPETLAVVLTTHIVDGEAPEHIAEEAFVAEQSLQKAPTDFVAASAVESVGQYAIDDLPPVPAPDVQGKVSAIETGAQLELDSVASVADVVEEPMEVAELVEIPTPAPEEFVALAEEISGPEASVDTCACGGAAQHTTTEALEGTALRPVATEIQVTLKAEAESATHVEESSLEIVSAVDTSAQIVAVEAEHAADQVPELATEETQPVVQDTVIHVAEAPLMETIPVPEIEAYIPPAQNIAEVEAQAVPEGLVFEARMVKPQDAGSPSPVPENAATVDETFGPEVTESVEAVPTDAPESDAAEGNTSESLVEAKVEAKVPPIDSISPAEEVQASTETELPTQFIDTPLVEVLVTESTREDATAALAAADEILARKTEAQPTPDTPSFLESAPIEDTLAVAIEASRPAQLAPGPATDSEPVAEKAGEPVEGEAQILVEDPVLSPSKPAAVTPAVIIEEPVVQDEQIPIEIEEPSSESATQSDDEAASPCIVAVSDPEEISSGTLATESELVETSAPAPIVEEAQIPMEAEEPSPVVDEAAGQVVASQPETAPVTEIDETHGAHGPQEIAEDAEQPVRSEIDISTHEPAGPCEEIVPAEP